MSNFKDVVVGELIHEKIAVVENLTAKVGTNDKIVTNFRLRDASGTIAGVYFGRFEAAIATGSVVVVNGAVGDFNGLQVKVKDAKLVEGDLSEFLESIMPVSQYPKEILVRVVQERIAKIEGPELRAFVSTLIEATPAYYTAPAGKRIHHAWVGGNAEHCAHVSILAATTAALYSGIDADLVIAGALLHDIGKTEELVMNGVIDYSDVGRLMGHAYIGAKMIEDHARFQPLNPELIQNLVHIILSHHGSLEHGAIVTPATVEAEIVYLCDMLDSKTVAAQAMINTDAGSGRWTSYNRMLDRTMRKPATAAISEGADAEAGEVCAASHGQTQMALESEKKLF